MALLSKVPGMRVLAPSSAQELFQMLDDAVDLADDGPVAIRYPRGAAVQVDESEVGSGLTARQVQAGDGSVCIIAVGRMLAPARKAADRLAAAGVDATVWDARCCVPLDDRMIEDAARHRAVVTAEDGVREGGIGMKIADRISAITPGTEVGAEMAILGTPTKFLPHGDPRHILAQCGLDTAGIANTAFALLAEAG